jgi:hypothetical protein
MHDMMRPNLATAAVKRTKLGIKVTMSEARLLIGSERQAQSAGFKPRVESDQRPFSRYSKRERTWPRSVQPANLSASNVNWRAQEMEPGLKRQSLLITGAGGGIGGARALATKEAIWRRSTWIAGAGPKTNETQKTGNSPP